MQEMQERPCGAMERRCTKRREPPSYMSYWSYMSYRVVSQSANQRERRYCRPLSYYVVLWHVADVPGCRENEGAWPCHPCRGVGQRPTPF